MNTEVASNMRTVRTPVLEIALIVLYCNRKQIPQQATLLDF